MPGSFPPWLPGIALSPGTSPGDAVRRREGPTISEQAEEPVGPLRCSARGCARNAEFALLWNNPKIHPPERRKTWLACDEHRTTLTDYLSARGMFRECEPVDADFADSSRDDRPAP
jgi:hypothetical protein